MTTPKTTNTPSLFPPAHHNAPAGTSEVAARGIAPRTPNDRKRVLALIRKRGALGLTDDEGERVLKMRASSYTPRRGELVSQGLIVDSGRRRPTESGRPAAVWVAVEQGVNA